MNNLNFKNQSIVEERFTDIEQQYLEAKAIESVQRSLDEIETFIKGVLRSEHPIGIRIDVDTPKEPEKYEDSAEKLERRVFGRPRSIFDIMHGTFSEHHIDPDGCSDTKTEPLDVTETVVIMTTLMNMRKAKLAKMREDYENKYL